MLLDTRGESGATGSPSGLTVCELSVNVKDFINTVYGIDLRSNLNTK